MGRIQLFPAKKTAWLTAAAALALFSIGTSAGKKPPKPEPNAEPKPDAKIDPGDLPSDLNLASLRVEAIDTLYEFDFSPQQLKNLQAAAVNTAFAKKRAAVKPNADIMKALKGFEAALLNSSDGATVAKLRNDLINAAGEAELDDEVRATPAAIAAAPGFTRRLTASQIAAFMALHADQVGDPDEVIKAALESARDLKAESGAKAAADIDSLIAESATTAAYLIAGSDDAKTKALAPKISAWIKTGLDLSDQQLAAQQSARDQAIQSFVGDVEPMTVLAHWIDLQVAELLANPELPAAIGAVTAANAAKAAAK